MNRKSNIQVVRGFSTAYLVFGIIGIVLAAVVLFVPAVKDFINSALPGVENVVLAVGIYGLVSALIDMLYFWLLRRFADGKSNGTVIMVLLIVQVVGNLFSAITTDAKSLGGINFILAAVALFYVIKARQEA